MFCPPRVSMAISFVLLGTLGNCLADVTLQKQISAEGRELYVLENEFLRLTVNPSRGGRGESLIYKKTGRDLTHSVSPTQAPGGSGLFLDRFWGDSRQIRDFEGLPYTVKIKGKGLSSAALTLTCTFANRQIEKTITLQKGCSSLQVDYAITNEGSEDYTGRFWVVNSVFPGDSHKRLTFFYPFGNFGTDENGPPIAKNRIIRIVYTPGEKPVNSNNFVTNPAEAWGAVVSEDNTGGAFEIEYPNFDFFYSWQPSPGDGAPIPTFEWLYSPMTLPPISMGKAEEIQKPEEADPLRGYIFRTGWKLIPFVCLPSVEGVSNGIVGSIVVDKNKATIGLVSDKNRDVEVVFQRRRLPSEGRKEELARRVINLLADKTESFSLQVTHNQKGTYVYKVILQEGKEHGEIAVFEVPYVHEEASALYVLKPKEAKNRLLEPKEESSPLMIDSTPCIPWATPLEKPIKTLLVTTIDSHRETAELVKRVDMDLTLVEFHRPHIFPSLSSAIPNYSWKVPDPVKALKKALEQNYDIILLGGSLYWNSVPKNLRNKILEKVKQGSGLIYIHPEHLVGTLKELFHSPAVQPDAEVLASGIPFPAVPGLVEFNPPSTVYSLRQYGKGRILFILYNPTPNGRPYRSVRGLTPVVYDDSGGFFPYWEYYYSFLAKGMLLTSHREPALTVSRLEFQRDKSNLLLTMSNSGEKTKVELLLKVFNRKWEQKEGKTQELVLSPGRNEINLPIDAEKLHLTGAYFFNVIVRKNGKAVDWATAWTDIVNPVHLVEVKLNQLAHSREEPISGEFVVENSPGKSLDAYSLAYRFTDVHQRTLAEETKKLVASEVKDEKVRLGFMERLAVPPLSELCWVEVELRDKDGIIDYAKTCFTVRPPPSEKDMTFMVWGNGDLYHWAERPTLKQLREIGFQRVTGIAPAAMRKDEIASVERSLLAADLQSLPMDMHRLAVREEALKETPVVRRPCLTDPEYLSRMESDVKRGVDLTKDFFPPAYFVADENSLGYYDAPNDFCQSPTCLKRLRAYLRGKYKSVSSLNHVWCTNFRTWEDVVPYTFAQAKEKHNFIPWAEHRLFMFSIFAEAVTNEKRFLREVAPEGKLAVSGMGAPTVFNGFDWYLLSQHLEFILGYTDRWPEMVDMFRSYKRKGQCLGSWGGYNAPPEVLRHKIWHEALNQFLTPGYFCVNTVCSHGGGDISKAGQDLKKIVGEIKGSGIGKILAEAEWIPSEIAIHQSTPSLVASYVTTAESPALITYQAFRGNLAGWVELIRDLGFQPPTFLSSYQMEEGILSPQKHPIFVLPLSQALSNKEIDNLVSYVKAGGILIADARAGVFLPNSSRRAKNPLDQVFGIFSSGEMEKTTSHIFLSEQDGKKPLPLCPMETRLTLKGGEAFGRADANGKTSGRFIPALIINKYGEGYGIYLNSILSEYPDLRKRGLRSKIVIEALRMILRKADYQPQLKVYLPVGAEVVRYKDGENLFLGLCRSSDYAKEANDVKITLPETKEIYNVRIRRHVGRSDSLSTTLPPEGVKFFALLPSKRESIHINAKLTSVGEIEYQIRLVDAEEKNASGIVRLDVYSPEGVLRTCYSKHLKVNGVYHGKIPLALNERKGEWELKVTDVLTGGESKEEISCK